MFDIKIPTIDTSKKKKQVQPTTVVQVQTTIPDVKFKRTKIIQYLLYLKKLYQDLKITDSYIRYTDILEVLQFDDIQVDYVYSSLLDKSKLNDMFTLPLAPSLCVFCIRYKNECAVCSYSKTHGECGFDENSTYMEILNNRSAIKNHEPIKLFWKWFTTFGNNAPCESINCDSIVYQRRK